MVQIVLLVKRNLKVEANVVVSECTCTLLLACSPLLNFTNTTTNANKMCLVPSVHEPDRPGNTASKQLK